jgi:adenylate cyclase
LKKYIVFPARRFADWVNPIIYRPSVGKAIRALALFAIFMALTDTRFWKVLEFRGFDALTVATAPGESQLPIVIVGIDDTSIAEINERWPWPRRLHAQLIDQLHQAGAAVIAFDVVFNSQTTSEDDDALSKSIAAAGNVVLIASASRQTTSQGTIWSRSDPLPAFVKAGAKVGMAQIEFEPDLVVRRFPLAADAFWKEILFRLRGVNPMVDFDSTLKDDRLIRFIGPDHSIPYVSYARVLGRGDPIPAETFDGALVLVGRETQAAADVGSAQVDVFATPFTAFNGLLTPGVEIHAAMVDNAVARSSVTEAPAWMRAVLLLAVAALSAFVPGKFRLASGAASALATCAGAAGLSYGLFLGANVWLPVIGAMALTVSSFLIHAMRAYSDELRQKARIRAAFSLFVPHAIADKLASQSAVLEPGGEEIELTSMFTDLAEFTSIAEDLRPAQVAELLNVYFDLMTDIVFRHGGTVQGYIGDALFAFWGAPVPDTDHRTKAAAAACEMAAAEHLINEKLKAKNLPAVHTRIGVHSGMAIVGNIGSKVRFNYTALGDTINLSSRLEALNKRYGTSLLISAETYQGVTHKAGFRRVERVRVKGREAPVQVYAACKDSWIVENGDRAIDLFLSREWAASVALWTAILDRDSKDPVAMYYLRRIADLQTQELGDAWDGIESIVEK